MKPPLRIAILGAESTGKSTLAAALAQHYCSIWVPEYLREFVELQGRTPREEEQIVIARTQIEREDVAAGFAGTFLFCDTTPLMTALYSCFYWGRVDPQLAMMARDRRYHLTLVTAPDTPWVADGLQRESEEVRQHLHEKLLEALAQLKTPYTLVQGTDQERMQQVTRLLHPLQDA
ncbi:AAA family ATPase [Noviherbaspirillum sp. Root189]|uniref:AAA family ATPase n=1 Tax=Noviherbaspirillum sp. Root189 TaxID=1736487 RepID=UPI000709CCA7|nr:ATP-binding protein [Noviherbaspirillum sp. Root189]KRB93760.1 nicotinamide-nucleotide adenylyltransferase [Noviherbaspirillum sp. Root189]